MSRTRQLQDTLPDAARARAEAAGATGRRWMRAYLAEACEVDARAIWQWGFMERVSTGLHLLELGMEAEAREMLEIADHWSTHPGP